jgi:hypothetical protein
MTHGTTVSVGCHGHACVAMRLPLRNMPTTSVGMAPRGPLAPGYCFRSTTSLAAWFLAAFLVLPGCGENSDSPADAAARPARSEVQRGPVRVTVEVQPTKVRLSDEAVLTLTIDSEEGVTVQKPPFGSTLGGFTIRDFREPLPKISNGHEVVQQIYRLEPTETGKLRIDPISVGFTDRRPGGDGRNHTVETEPLSIEVTSLVGDKAPSLGELRPPADPMELPSRLARWLWGLLAAGAAALAVAWWLWRRRRREKAVAAVILSPEELANIELNKLVESGLAERDIKQFYVELTSIVRRYIERTTGIRAPEETTEEFLREISQARSLSFGETARAKGIGNVALPSPPASLPKGEGSLLDECSRLRDFLEAADLVKFAAHRPRADDIAESIRRARLFIAAKERAVSP